MDDGSVIQVIQKQRQRTPIKNLATRSQIFYAISGHYRFGRLILQQG